MSLDVRLTIYRPYKPFGAFNVFDNSINDHMTHISQELGIYEVLWRPQNLGMIYAHDIVPALNEALRELVQSPTHYQSFFTPVTGSFKAYVAFLEHYRDACNFYPDAEINVCT